jgi:serine/threonine protein kinase HipA of HipAB toxin-antitoxin module
MNIESYVREQVRKILLEKTDNAEVNFSKTSGPGPGRFKKELKDMKAMADTEPAKLVGKLGISAAGSTPGDSFEALLSSAASGDPAMAEVYSNAEKVKDQFGREGATIDVSGMPVRDALIFIRETVKAASATGAIRFMPAQVEILDGKIVVYQGASAFSWNVPKKDDKKKDKKKEDDKKKEENKPDEKES